MNAWKRNICKTKVWKITEQSNKNGVLFKQQTKIVIYFTSIIRSTPRFQSFTNRQVFFFLNYFGIFDLFEISVDRACTQVWEPFLSLIFAFRIKKRKETRWVATFFKKMNLNQRKPLTWTVNFDPGLSFYF